MTVKMIWCGVALMAASMMPILVLSQDAEPDVAWARILGVFGITATPSQMRGDTKVFSGQIWTVSADDGHPIRVTEQVGFSSPVFLPDGAGFLAARGDEIVRVSRDGAAVKSLYTIPDQVKIVGFEHGRKKFLVLREAPEPILEIVSLTDGRREVLPLESGPKQVAMLNHIAEWTRIYGDITLYQKINTRRGFGGRIQRWVDVFVEKDGIESNRSRCDRINCGQPSLSLDGMQIVYIREKP